MCDSWWKLVSSRFSKLLIFKRRLTLQHEKLEPKTLLKLPMNIVNLVFEKMEPKELLKLRKVCTTLKTAVDEFGIHFNSIHFELDVKGFTLSLDDGCFIYIGEVDGGTAVDHCHRRITFDGENFVDIGFKDLKMLLKSVSLLKIHSKSNYMIKSLIDALKPEEAAESLKVESIELRNFSFEDVVAFLPYFGTHTLKCIKLGKHIQQIKQFQQIAVLDQWKNAENFQIEIGSFNCISEIIDHISHFQCFHINIMSEFPTQVAVRMRDDLMKRETFQHCTITVDEFNLNPIELARVFKPDYVGDDKKYKLEYSNDYYRFEVALVISDKAPKYPFNFSVRRLQKSCTH